MVHYPNGNKSVSLKTQELLFLIRRDKPWLRDAIVWMNSSIKDLEAQMKLEQRSIKQMATSVNWRAWFMVLIFKSMNTKSLTQDLYLSRNQSFNSIVKNIIELMNLLQHFNLWKQSSIVLKLKREAKTPILKL